MNHGRIRAYSRYSNLSRIIIYRHTATILIYPDNALRGRRLYSVVGA
jgi:hypothetical protein